MTNKNQEVVKNVLLTHSCLTTKQISYWAKRLFDYDISAASAAGSLRAMAKQGIAGCSNCGAGGNHWWIVE